jgi:nitrite reductase/ring-hydroxylating ferredoxin subunit
VVDCVVTCPLHESQFDVRDGHIVRGPAHHPQPALPSRVRNGFIEVRGSQPGRRRATT